MVIFPWALLSSREVIRIFIVLVEIIGTIFSLIFYLGTCLEVCMAWFYGSDKRRIYVVWTVNFFEHVRAHASDLVVNLSESESNQLSGETVFEMEESGLVRTLYIFLPEITFLVLISIPFFQTFQRTVSPCQF